MKKNDIAYIKAFAEVVLEEHNLATVSVKINNRLSRSLGRSCGNHTLEINGEFANYGRYQAIEEVILHEIAHFIDKDRRGYSNHDRTFKAICREINCNIPNSNVGDLVLWREDYQKQSKYTAICPVCGEKHHKARKPQKLRSCGKCSKVFDRTRILEFKANW